MTTGTDDAVSKRWDSVPQDYDIDGVCLFSNASLNLSYYSLRSIFATVFVRDTQIAGGYDFVSLTLLYCRLNHPMARSMPNILDNGCYNRQWRELAAREDLGVSPIYIPVLSTTGPLEPFAPAPGGSEL